MFDQIVNGCRTLISQGLKWVETQILSRTKPCSVVSVLGTADDLARSKRELVIEDLSCGNILWCWRAALDDRLSRIPTGDCWSCWRASERASKLKAWWEALSVVKSDILLGWHRKIFGGFWRRKSAVPPGRPSLEDATVALIKQMVSDNPLWGAEHIRGELLKVDVKFAKSTIQKYMCQIRTPRPSGQTWLTLLHQHAKVIWACDFLPVIDLVFRQYFAFFIVELGSRKVVHVGVTDAPTDVWMAQQLREATPFGEGPKSLIHDRDSKFGI